MPGTASKVVMENGLGTTSTVDLGKEPGITSTEGMESVLGIINF